MALLESRRRVSHAWGRSTEMSRTEQVFEQTEKFESDCRSQSASDIPSLGGTGVRTPATQPIL